MRPLSSYRLPSSLAYISGVLALLNTVAYNIPFFRFVSAHAEMSGTERGLLMVSLVVLMLLLHYWVFYLLLRSLRRVGKALVAVLLFLNAVCVYFVVTYSALMDEGMMSNVFNTRYSEASGFFSWSLWLWIAAFGLLPAVWICLRKIDYGSWRRLSIVSASTLGLSLLVVLVNLNQVLWIGKYDTELGGLIMPWSYLVNTGRLAAHRMAENKQEILLPDGSWDNEDAAALVLVIGESSRRANWQLYGYERETNPLLSQRSDIVCYTAQSCATYTTAGVKAILEDAPHASLYEILPNYLYRMGADVEWRTFNWGEPPVHGPAYLLRRDLAERYAMNAAYDECLFAGVRERIESSARRKVLLVLHTSTSHGPDYQLQYPDAFSYFLPVCSRVEDAQKERDHLINAYDNSICYTDYLLSTLIDTLATVTSHRCAMLYISDHGESLGENDLFMHGVPMKIAPRTQYEIPCLLWTQSDSSLWTQSDNSLCARITAETIDQHYVFSTVLRWLGVSSPVYDASRDLLSTQQ